MREQTKDVDRAAELPPLKLAIKQGGEMVRMVEVPDPRAFLIRQLSVDELGISAEVA